MKLQKSPNFLVTYDNNISNQLKEAIAEKVDKSIPPNIPQNLLPTHRPVPRANAESAKVRVVYDASTRPDNQSKWVKYCDPQQTEIY